MKIIITKIGQSGKNPIEDDDPETMSNLLVRGENLHGILTDS